ncbi:hypothetical protein [Streptomyces olivaceoviridis]|uniref:hypothetical protein n=1 Tax=Streptomyces olivaceoviridis TaxID=1921 RepID=UPI003328638B
MLGEIRLSTRSSPSRPTTPAHPLSSAAPRAEALVSGPEESRVSKTVPKTSGAVAVRRAVHQLRPDGAGRLVGDGQRQTVSGGHALVRQG